MKSFHVEISVIKTVVKKVRAESESAAILEAKEQIKKAPLKIHAADFGASVASEIITDYQK